MNILLHHFYEWYCSTLALTLALDVDGWVTNTMHK